MLNLLKELDALVWGPPLLILLVGTGNIIGCGNGYQSWWPKSSLLDVDGSFFWNGNHVCRRTTCH